MKDSVNSSTIETFLNKQAFLSSDEYVNFSSQSEKLLERLQVIHPTLETGINYKKSKEIFLDGFIEIANCQYQEIKHFFDRFNEMIKGMHTFVAASSQNLKNFCLILEKNFTPINSLKMLELRHELLENINLTLIEQSINVQSQQTNTLNISKYELTRFPSHFNQNPKLKNYWRDLECIDASFNRFRSIPKTLVSCKKLNSIDFSNNCLRHLPIELIQCPQLKHFNVKDNYCLEIPAEYKKKFGKEWYESQHKNSKMPISNYLDTSCGDFKILTIDPTHLPAYKNARAQQDFLKPIALDVSLSDFFIIDQTPSPTP